MLRFTCNNWILTKEFKGGELQSYISIITEVLYGKEDFTIYENIKINIMQQEKSDDCKTNYGVLGFSSKNDLQVSVKADGLFLVMFLSKKNFDEFVDLLKFKSCMPHSNLLAFVDMLDEKIDNYKHFFTFISNLEGYTHHEEHKFSDIRFSLSSSIEANSPKSVKYWS